MSTTNSTIITRYVCRYCNCAMAYATTPAGELAYECTNRACQFVAMVGCECAMNEAPEPTPAAPAAIEPTPIAARSAADRARDKAAYFLAQGLRVVETRGAYLVPSGTRGNVIHRVQDGRCSCEAGQSGKTCWHVAAIALLDAELIAA